MKILTVLIISISLSLIIVVPSYAYEQFQIKGNGISLDSNQSTTTLYKTSFKINFNNISQITKGSIILKSDNNVIAARMIPDQWLLSYNADGTFSGHGPLKTLQNKDYNLKISGSRQFVASNWSTWNMVGILESSNGESYSIQAIVSGNDRFAETASITDKVIVIPKGNSKEIDSGSYVPVSPTFFRGTKVIWMNLDDVTHTIQSQDGQGNVISVFNSDVLHQGDEFQYKFDKPGIYHYLCSLHPWRTGTVIVA